MDAVLMFKTPVLNALYNLSDDQIKYQVCDRLSFMRFLGRTSCQRARKKSHLLVLPGFRD